MATFAVLLMSTVFEETYSNLASIGLGSEVQSSASALLFCGKYSSSSGISGNFTPLVDITLPVSSSLFDGSELFSPVIKSHSV